MPRLDGFDGAHYQTDYGEPNLAATLLAGLWWIAWKVSQSDQYHDPTFARIRSQWGRFRCRGMYHWLSSTKDVDAQAANFLRGIGVIQVGEFVMLDAEEMGISVAKCLRWCEIIEAITHRPVVIYTGLYVEGGSIWKSVPLRHSKYGVRPFIVAAYVSEANLTARMWATGSLPDYPYHAWQFGSNGPVPGIVGRCDMDQIDDVPAFLLACGIDDIFKEDEMQTQLLKIDGYAAQLLAQCSDTGAALTARWTGPADDGGITNERIEWFRAAFRPTAMQPNFEMGPFSASLLINISLDDDLPPGMVPELFANAAAIRRREEPPGVIDEQCREDLLTLRHRIADAVAD